MGEAERGEDGLTSFTCSARLGILDCAAVLGNSCAHISRMRRFNPGLNIKNADSPLDLKGMPRCRIAEEL